ncbi:MAG: hypothetical protein PHU23_00405 [Dehalococcoidales bacterium]|nr:hypothetical protein [Dehalococcoidales bacterium]
MAESEKTTLDYIDKITVEGKPFLDPANEYYALICLKSGLDHLYRFASKCDEICLSQIDPGKKHFFMGNVPGVKGIPYPMLTCAFQWYAISACQYVKTIGTIGYRQDNTRPKSDVYLNSIIGEVKNYRDKVAAHFAWLTKNEHDNDAERLASIIPQVSFWGNSFHVGAIIVSLGRKGKMSSSKDIKPWSIVNIHKILQKRYWPEEISTS